MAGRRVRLAHPTGTTGRGGDADSRSGEDGVIVVMFAISIVALLILATLVIDGSQAYPLHRRMQNAADASATAAARQLDKVRWSGAAWTTVDATATTVAVANGAASQTCTVITSVGASIGSCGNQASVQSANASGVKVITTQTRPTTFGLLAGRASVTAIASASATIQPLAGTATPFIVCGNPDRGGYPILNPDDTINVAAAQAMGTIDIQAAQVPTCGAGSAFKGKIEDSADVVVPGWVAADNGNGYDADIEVVVADAVPCPKGGPFTGCDMIVPIADQGAGNGNNITMHAVAWAVFHISGDGTGNPKYRGYFRSALVYASGGTTTNGQVSNAAQMRVIRLIG